MGKRKRRVHPPPIAPLSASGYGGWGKKLGLAGLHEQLFDAVPCSSGMNPLSTEKIPNHISTRIVHPYSSTEDIMGSHEQQNEHISISNHQHHHHHHNNPGRSMHSKRSRNRGQHHPRHNSGYHYNTYYGKNSPSFDHQIPFKTGNNRWTPEHNTEGRERAFFKPERIRSNETPMEVITREDDNKMVCGTCERLLRQKHPLGSGLLTTSEPSVVAVLVCGHFFHADCLERRTPADDASDPQCPLCLTH
ncbi:hypothetical protein V2J09_018767 [Rumex salicifolius]